MPYAIAFSVALMVVQLMEKTSGAFCMLHAAFIVLSVMAFNLTGGFTRASGFYIFFYSTLTVLFGTVLKAVLGERPDLPAVTHPLQTMAVFTASAAALLLAATISRMLTKNVPSIAARIGTTTMSYKDASLGCTFLAFFIAALRTVLDSGPGSLLAFLIQVDIFLPLAIILGTIDKIQESGGRKSIGLINFIPIASQFLFGVVFFGKEAMLTPFACWMIAVAYTRFRLRLVHFITCAAFGVIIVMVFYPLAQYGRNFADVNNDVIADATVAWNLLQDIPDLRKQASIGLDELAEGEQETAYFQHQVGFAERFTRWPGDGELINFSSTGHYVGYAVITESFLNWIPHFLIPDRDKGEKRYTGNYYAHELGSLSDDDLTTGISYSPTAEAFHIDGWPAIFVLLPSIWVLLFVTSDLLCGDLRDSPWGLFFAVAFSHVAPESLLSGLINFIFHGSLALFLGMTFCVSAAPVIGILVTGSARRSKILQAPTFEAKHASA